MLCTFSKDKDVDSCLELIKQKASAVYIPTIDHERLKKSQTLINILKGKGCKKVEIIHELNEVSFNKMIDENKEKLFLICGSFFFLKPIYQIIGKGFESDPIEMQEKYI